MKCQTKCFTRKKPSSFHPKLSWVVFYFQRNRINTHITSNSNDAAPWNPAVTLKNKDQRQIDRNPLWLNRNNSVSLTPCDQFKERILKEGTDSIRQPSKYRQPNIEKVIIEFIFHSAKKPISVKKNHIGLKIFRKMQTGWTRFWRYIFCFLPLFRDHGCVAKKKSLWLRSEEVPQVLYPFISVI